MSILHEGTFEYNGVLFDAFGKSEVSSSPVYDDANRMVKYVEIRFHFRGIASAGTLGQNATSTDDFIDFIRRRLTQNGGTLIYSEKGFGNFTVNIGPLWDVDYGPHPKLVNFQPIGSKRACFVEWECITRVPQCPNGDQVLNNGVVELTYSVNWTMDLDGIHVVTTTGKLEIAKNFDTQAPNFNKTADDFWNQIYITQQPGWQRDQRTKHLSHDRRTLTWTFQDRELPVPLPNGQTRARIKHTFKNTNRGFVAFSHHIRGEFNTDRSLSRFTSFRNFIICVNNIIDNIRNSLSGVSIIPTEIECGEEILGLEETYAFSFLVAGTKINRLITTSGLWQRIPNTDHISWLASIINSSGDPRGLLGNDAKYNINSDILVDLCQNQEYEAYRRDKDRRRIIEEEETTVTRNEKDKRRFIIDSDADNDSDLVNFYNLENYKPEDGESNWLVWDMELVDIENNHVVRHKPLYGTTKTVDFEADLEKPNTIVNLDQNIIAPHSEVNVESDAEDILQKINTPSTFVMLRGRAVRYGYRIPVPRLLKYGDAEIAQVSCVAPERNLAPTLGIPIYERRWEILYMLSRPQMQSPNVIKPYPGLPDGDYGKVS